MGGQNVNYNQGLEHVGLSLLTMRKLKKHPLKGELFQSPKLKKVLDGDDS